MRSESSAMTISARIGSWTAAILPPLEIPQRRPQVEALFNAYEQRVVRRTNQFFQWLLPLQWAFAVFIAAMWSPLDWSGTRSSVHPHLLAAVLLGGLLTAPPLFLMAQRPYDLLTRHVVAIAQMGFSSLLIDVTGGRIETHFHVFGSLAFLALYRDWRVLPTATLVVALDHLVGGLWFPEAVYGVPMATVWRTAEHSGWVVFEDLVLIWASLVSRREMWEICLRQDENEQLLGNLEQRVRDRTRDLTTEVQEHQRTAQELRLSEERYRQLIANVPIGIIETTRAGEMRLANPRLLSILGLDAKLEIGQVDMADGRIFPLAERERFWKTLESEREVRGFEVALNRADGTKVEVVLNARLKPPPLDGGPAICEGTVEDVTERKRAAVELEKMHQRLVVASREAGMAEVATGVLHNVGNVLTSVNLIVHDVQDRLKSTRLHHLHLVVKQLQAEQSRLAAYFTDDPAGRAMPEFLVKLDRHLAAENATLAADVETLRNHCEHIRDIIVSQQHSARLFGVTENLAPAQLIDDALLLNADSLRRHDIALEKALTDVPRIKADRHKVLQILVNLIKNAKDSVIGSRVKERRIVVSVAAVNDHAVALSVGDNGSGIEPENRCRIFQHGFTTKDEGHGFGLHSCALAAREMRGDLTMASDGPGRGATFTLSLPVAETAPR
jgi:PAS domain S-box-containing protein